MVNFGYKEGMDYYNLADARRMANIGGVPEPSDEDVKYYGPFKAVARLVIDKYVKDEPIGECLGRNMPRAMRVLAGRDLVSHI